jgi:hypothetical protein
MSVDFKLAQPTPRLGTRDDPPESRYAQARDSLNPAEIRADWFPGGASEAMIAKYSREDDETFQASFTSGDVEFVRRSRTLPPQRQLGKRLAGVIPRNTRGHSSST